MQAALEKEATVRLARFERMESWNGLVPGDAVRIAGHRGGTWKFRAFVTNTSNGASWVEVSEVLAAGRRRSTAQVDSGDGDEPQVGGTSMTRTRSFRPELVTPVRRSARRRQRPKAPPATPIAEYQPSVQTSLFDQESDRET